MNLTPRAGVLCAVLACLPPSAGAYEFETHRTFSTTAAAGSKLSDMSLVNNLGLRRPITDIRQYFPNSRGSFNTVQGLIGDGAVLEDVPAIRVVNHFYDPINDDGVFYTSPRWALEDTGIAFFQKYSLKMARGYEFEALTNAQSFERFRNMGLFFESVGHVVHHVQDMAQPQHVRMDAHLNIQATLQEWGLPDAELFFEHRSRYELYTESNLGSISPMMTVGSAPVLAKARDYWKNDAGTGMAQYTNRNFVSAGTNFELRSDGSVGAGTRYANPVPTATPTEVAPIRSLFAAKGKPVPAQVATACPAANDCNVLFFGSPVSSRASSLSIFDEDLVATGRPVTYVNPDTSLSYQVNRAFALNEFNFDAALGLLVPRATDYSAGLINYIFRGQLEISAPDDVVFAILDPTQADSFPKIKLKVRNTTPNETMAGGKLWAVARFHRNNCYRPDMTGEYGGPNAPDIIACRSLFEEVVVSAPSEPVTLPPNGTPMPISFSFGATPIPVNATDLFLQVVYRGALGNEANSVAVGSKDLFEPTHIAYMNGTDIIEINDRFYTFQQILDGIAAGDPTFFAVDANQDKVYASPPDAYVTPQDLTNVPISFAGSNRNVVANIPSLPNGRFARITVLTDRPVLDFYPGPQHFQPYGAYNQVDENTYYVTSTQIFRGFWVTNADIIFLCVYPTSCNGELTSIPPSTVADAMTPKPMNVTMQFP